MASLVSLATCRCRKLHCCCPHASVFDFRSVRYTILASVCLHWHSVLVRLWGRVQRVSQTTLAASKLCWICALEPLVTAFKRLSGSDCLLSNVGRLGLSGLSVLRLTICCWIEADLISAWTHLESGCFADALWNSDPKSARRSPLRAAESSWLAFEHDRARETARKRPNSSTLPKTNWTSVILSFSESGLAALMASSPKTAAAPSKKCFSCLETALRRAPCHSSPLGGPGSTSPGSWRWPWCFSGRRWGGFGFLSSCAQWIYYSSSLKDQTFQK